MGAVRPLLKPLRIEDDPRSGGVHGRDACAKRKETTHEPERGHPGRRDVPVVGDLEVSERWPCRTCCGQDGRAPVHGLDSRPELWRFPVPRNVVFLIVIMILIL